MLWILCAIHVLIPSLKNSLHMFIKDMRQGEGEMLSYGSSHPYLMQSDPLLLCLLCIDHTLYALNKVYLKMDCLINTFKKRYMVAMELCCHGVGQSA